MESKSVFPVFGELHADDSPAVEIPYGKMARKVYENAAGLYLVSDGQAEQQNVEQEQETEPGPLKVTGELEDDTVAALYSLAYLSAFFSALEPDDLRELAAQLGVRR